MDLIDRLDASEQIRQIVSRYAVAYDARDLDTLVRLHAPGRREHVREAIRTQLPPGRTFHLVAEPVITFDSDTTARGIVVCRAEREDDGEWIVAGLTYEDRYVREGDTWYLADRHSRVEYSSDVLSRP